MGTTLNRGVSTVDEGNHNGTTVAPNIAAPDHQHFFNFRIDFDVDGTSNRVLEENTASTASAGGNAFATTATPLTSEGSRDTKPASARSWVVENATKRNALGQPTAYALQPQDAAVPYSDAAYPPLQRAAFAQHPLWVTRYKEGESFAAGDYPNQSDAGPGVAAFASPAQSTDKQDSVVWYTTGFTHHPTIEEFPTMSRESVGFQLVPDGFFDSYPALDAPAQP
jgi:primary-amine oxidase